MVIENFAELSFEEQKKFAEALVKTINTENTFTDQTNFKVESIEADEMTGGLIIVLEHEGTINVYRDASWSCTYHDEASQRPDSPEFNNSDSDDAKEVFKTLAVELEGYSVTLSVDDVDTEDIVDVEVSEIYREDDGIGHYDYFGHRGYDSSSYFVVEGVLGQACYIYCSLYVEAADHFQADIEEE
jgi:hypothetical protein